MRTRVGPVLGLVLLLGGTAGCGGGGAENDNKIASVGTPTSTPSTERAGGDERDKLLRYAKCMRENGVPDFPDPEFQSGGGVSLDLPEGADPQRVDTAQITCKALLPNGGENTKVDPEVTERLRAYAKCMRDNGITKFPDPSPEGGLQVNNGELGLAPDDPKLNEAERTCSRHMPKPPGGGDTPTRNSGDAA